MAGAPSLLKPHIQCLAIIDGRSLIHAPSASENGKANLLRLLKSSGTAAVRVVMWRQFFRIPAHNTNLHKR